MTISTIDNAGYATDGGSIFLEFSTSDGIRHTLELVQETLPITDPGLLYQNGDVIFNGEQVVDDEATLRELAAGIAAVLAADKRVAHKCELPPYTTVLSEDLKELMTTDEVGREQLLLTWAQQRLEKKLQR